MLRRILLELWAIFLLACVVGAMGPFGTYLQDKLVDRITQWWLMAMGAYLLIRPAIPLLRGLARASGLSIAAVSYWGVALSSIPLAILWKAVGRNAFRHIDGYAGLIPFSLLCAACVMAIVQWAAHAEMRARRRLRRPIVAANLPERPPPPPLDGAAEDMLPVATPRVEPALLRRLPSGFQGPILALQSEDHYVRVHGPNESALLLMRLRDAIGEMEGASGEQVHRSWWVARDAASCFEPHGRSWIIRLTNGHAVPIARESALRLRRVGFLPTEPVESPN